ncbi:metallopeptidase family protein [Corynebacterium tapiri]|nr:metallopeptidase family protein [Corynebacterium tapiri]
MRTSRDRRGRGIRGPLLPQSVPRFRTRSELFDVRVLQAYAPIHRRFADQLANLDIAVDVIPRMRLSADSTVLPDDIAADGPVPLGRVLPAGVDAHGRPTRARMVVFRQPIQQRCTTPAEELELLTWVITALTATHMNLDPRDIDPDFEL